jgi:predicted metal-dependent hydrolase
MTDTQTTPKIVGFVADLMFTSKIELAARAAGFQMIWVGQAEDIGAVDPHTPPETPGELLYGREGQLFQKISEWQPALLLFDLTNTAVPWYGWIPALKSSPATRRIPIIAFGPHEDVALFQSAKDRGADVVYARSRFVRDMPAILQKQAHIPDYAALADTCAEPLAALAREGIALFNAGAYYQCHDALEAAWNEDATLGRDLYRGILQFGIALYQIERGNHRGAVKMLLRVRQWLDPLPDVCRGVRVAELRANIQEVATAVQSLGAAELGAFDFALVRPVQLVEDAA